MRLLLFMIKVLYYFPIIFYNKIEGKIFIANIFFSALLKTINFITYIPDYL